MKILALVTMTVDHVGVVIFPQYLILRIIGRLTYPIFAYMIAEGCYYTHSKKRYLGGIVLLGLACQAGFFVATQSLEQSILTTFTLSILVIYALQRFDEKRDVSSATAVAGAVLLTGFVCMALPGLLPGTDFHVDYGFWGCMLPAFCYLPRILFPKMVDKKRLKYMAAFATVGLVLLCIQMNGWLHHIQWFSLLAVILLTCYNGQRGKHGLKHVFYIYYPLHLIAIWGLGMIIR